jgi:hypothetical protein
MSTAVPSSANFAAGQRDSSPGSTPSLALRRAPVLLRLPALHAPAPSAETLRTHQEKPAVHHPREPEPEETAPGHSSSSHRRQHHRHESHAGESRRERSSRRHQRGETRKKSVPLSQWLLGGCMLAAGVVGFFVLSGDFGGGDAPPVDGWSQRGDDQASPSPQFDAPQPVDAPAVTVHREPVAASQAGGAWPNPAEGAIAPAPSAQPTPAGPPWMNGAAMPAADGSIYRAEASSSSPAAPASHGTTAAGQTADVPSTAPPSPELTPPGNTYPTTTGATAPAAPGVPQAQASYPSTGFGEGPVPSLAPAARVGMREAGSTSGYPTTGAPQSPFPNNVTPPAMSPRYERIR